MSNDEKTRECGSLLQEIQEFFETFQRTAKNIWIMLQCNVLLRRVLPTLNYMLEVCNSLKKQVRKLKELREEGDKIAKTVDQLTPREELKKAVWILEAITDRCRAEYAVLVTMAKDFAIFPRLFSKPRKRFKFLELESEEDFEVIVYLTAFLRLIVKKLKKRNTDDDASRSLNAVMKELMSSTRVIRKTVTKIMYIENGSASVSDSCTKLFGDTYAQLIGDTSTQLIGNISAQLIGHTSAQFIGETSTKLIGDTSAQFIGDTSTQLIVHTSTQLIGDTSAQFIGDTSTQLIGDTSAQFIGDTSTQLFDVTYIQFIT